MNDVRTSGGEPAADASASDAARTHREELPVLVTRLRAGAMLVALSIVLFGVHELWARRASLAVFFVVKAVQLATVAVVWVSLRRPRTWRFCVGLGLAFVGEVWITLAASGALTGDVASAPLLFIVFVTASGALLPWGLGPQVATVAIAATAVVAQLAGAAALPDGFGYTAIAAVLAGVASIYVAAALDHARRAQARAEAEERESVTALRDEVVSNEASARVAGAMIACLDTPLLLDRLCALTTEVLACDASRTYEWDTRASTLVAIAHAGAAAPGARSREHVPASVVGELRGELGTDDVACVAGGLADRLLPGARTVLATPLRRGERLAGLHVAGRYEARFFTVVERRIAQGIAQTVSVALANSHLVDELASAHRAKTEFLGTLAHELRTPIDAVVGYAEMAEGESNDVGGRPEALRRVRQAAHDVLHLIEHTLELGRIEAGRDEVRVEAVPLVPFWRELGESSARLPWRPGVALEWGEAPAAAVVHTDPRKLAIIVKNLVSNALKFTERGVVRVRVDVDGHQVIVQVADSGVGIASEEQAGIFEMYRQGSTGRRQVGGSGLGLHIVKRFVDQLGGRVAVASSLGNGAAFTVTLPVRPLASVIDAA
jgi:signal transduction histidine kinase